MPVKRTTKEELRQRLEGGDAASAPLILDVRLKYPYEHSTVRLPGAVRMPPWAVDPSRLARDRDIVAYDSDPGEITSSNVAVTLIGQGYRVSVLKGGIAEWVTASFPTEPKERAATPPAQA